MKPEQLKDFLNRKIKLQLKNGTVYTGSILELNIDTLKFLDKFNNNCLIDLSSIASISDLSGGY